MPVGFVKGVSGNPRGRPKGSVGGRQLMLIAPDAELVRQRKSLRMLWRKMMLGQKLSKRLLALKEVLDKYAIALRPNGPREGIAQNEPFGSTAE